MQTIKSWFQERLPISGEDLREWTNEPVPHHLKRWWFCLGGTPAYLFLVQVITGILLAIYYQPTASTAYESVAYITDRAIYGWYLRSLHKWAATFMIAAVILHQIRVYFTAAYRKPREINWIIGMGLLLCVLTEGFTGYSLVYEQLSYWGATVGANIAETVPILGGVVKKMMLAGDAYNAHTLPRFYIIHAAVLPATIVVLLFLHIFMIRLQGVSELKFEIAVTLNISGQAEESADPGHKGGDKFNFFPDHVYTEMIIGLVLMILLTTLALLWPANLGPRANPLVTPEIIKPEWFFYVTFRWLKLFSATAAVLSMGFIVFTMFAWPLIDAWMCRKFNRKDIHVWLGIAVVLTIIGLTVWEASVVH